METIAVLEPLTPREILPKDSVGIYIHATTLFDIRFSLRFRRVDRGSQMMMMIKKKRRPHINKMIPKYERLSDGEKIKKLVRSFVGRTISRGIKFIDSQRSP